MLGSVLGLALGFALWLGLGFEPSSPIVRELVLSLRGCPSRWYDLVHTEICEFRS